MNSKVEKLETNKVKLEIEVDAARFEEGMQKSYFKNVKRFNVPGFRKGKAPRQIIENYYGEGVFYEDAINEVCPEAYDAAIDEHNLEPVDRPEIDILQIGGGENLIFTATVTVKPEVELGDYKGIEVNKVEYNVTDEDVERELTTAQDRVARWVAVEDRPVKEHDRVTIDFAGFIDGKQFPGGSAENQSLEIGSGHFIPGFEEQIVGMNIGEEKEIQVTFPEEYHVEDLQGKAATFKVKLHEIKEKEVPDLDDEFAKDVSEFDTLEEYKADIRKKLEENAANRAKVEMEDQLIKKVVENASVEIPDVMVERQIDNLIRDFEFRLMYQGLSLDKYLEYTGTSKEGFRAQYRDEAYNRVKTQLVLEKISKVENIVAEEEDINKEISRMAEQYKKEVEEFRSTLREEDIDYISDGIVLQKTIDFLAANQVIVDAKDANVDVK